MVFNAIENFIDGKEFVALEETDVRGMIPPVGIAKKIIRLIPTKVNSL